MQQELENPKEILQQEAAYRLNQKQTNHQILLSICLSVIGSVYASQEIPTLHDHFKQYFAQNFNSSFEFYYNIQSTVSLGALMFICPLIGHLCDIYSNGLVFIVETQFILLGQFLVYLSFYFSQYWFFFTGRIIIFISIQTIFTSCKIFINSYSAENQKGYLFGLLHSFIVLGKCLSLIVDPVITDKYGIEISIILTLILVSLSSISSIFSYQIELSIQSKQQEQDTITASTEDLEQIQEQQQREISQLQQILQFDNKFWLFTIICSFSLLVTSIVDLLLPTYIASYWSYDPLTAAQISSIAQIYGFFNWLIGMGLDQFKDRQYELLIFSNCVTSIGLIILTQINPLFGVVLVGLGDNINKIVMIPLLCKIVSKESLGKAYGVLRGAFNFLAMISFFIISITITKTKSYQCVFESQIFICLIYSFASVVLFQISKKH